MIQEQTELSLQDILFNPFLPREASPEIAHQIGLELCRKILKDKYEYV